MNSPRATSLHSAARRLYRHVRRLLGLTRPSVPIDTTNPGEPHTAAHEPPSEWRTIADRPDEPARSWLDTPRRREGNWL